jgi:hypothetical protein
VWAADSQRQKIILDQGELGFTTDTQRLFVGNGVLSGGIVVGNITHPFLPTSDTRISLSNAVKGDTVNENGWLYQLSGSDYSKLSSWGFIGSKSDNSSIGYNINRELEIKNNGIGATKFASGAAYSLGGLVATPTSGLSANIDRETLTITSTNQLSVFKITENQIQSSSLGDGLTGGNGQKLKLNVGSGLGFSSGVLTLTGSSTNSVGVSAISPDAIGPGISLSAGKIIADIRTISLSSFILTDGKLELAPRTGATPKFANIIYNDRGIITDYSSTITQIFTGSETTASPLSLFNGSLDQETYSNQTIISAMSSTNMILLSSAGFAVIESTEYGNFAIPVFKF